MPSRYPVRWLDFEDARTEDELGIASRLRRLRGYRALPQLRIALQQVIMQGKEVLVT
jgi:hypothetical protein